MRCPNCESRKYKGNEVQKHCERCGFLWKNPLYHKATVMSGSRIGYDKVVGMTTNVQSMTTNRPIGDLLEIDYHGVAYKFPIKKDNPDVHLPIKIPMKNWTMEQEESSDFVVRRTPTNLIVYYKPRTKTTLGEGDKALSEVKELIIQEAISYMNRYNLLLDLENISAVRKEVKVISPFVSAGTLFKGRIAKSVYESGQVEFIDKDNAMEHTKNFIEGLAVENKADKIVEILEVFGKGMEQHMALIRQLQDSNRALQESAKTMQNYKPFWMVIKERMMRWIRGKER